MLAWLQTTWMAVSHIWMAVFHIWWITVPVAAIVVSTIVALDIKGKA